MAGNHVPEMRNFTFGQHQAGQGLITGGRLVAFVEWRGTVLGQRNNLDTPNHTQVERARLM